MNPISPPYNNLVFSIKRKDKPMDRFQFQTVPNIIAGLGAIQELSQILKKGRYERLLLVTDPGMFQHKLHLPILDIVEDAGLDRKSTRLNSSHVKISY